MKYLEEKTISLFCDESCHLENDRKKHMILGLISCGKRYVKQINRDIKAIKTKHGINLKQEIKWVNFSKTRYGLYKEFVDYFFDNDKLSFRVLIAPKQGLNFDKFYIKNHTEWYYRMYYFLFKNWYIYNNNLNIYIDERDTQSCKKIKELESVLKKITKNTETNNIKIKNIKSYEIELMQILDILIGAVNYRNNMSPSENHKTKLVYYIAEKMKVNLASTTQQSNPSYEKFNIFRWRKQDVWVVWNFT